LLQEGSRRRKKREEKRDSQCVLELNQKVRRRNEKKKNRRLRGTRFHLHGISEEKSKGREHFKRKMEEKKSLPRDPSWRASILV